MGTIEGALFVTARYQEQVWEPAPKLWVVPKNDLEALEIIKYLQGKKEEFLITGQGWGASWAGLEPEIKAYVNQWVKTHSAEKRFLYGVELQGEAPEAWQVINIDHHVYGDEDRHSIYSSIEQVMLEFDPIGGGRQLNRWQTLVSANDKGYIPEMRKYGASWDEILEVRAADRAAQGLTPEQEAAAQEAIASKEVYGNLKVVRLTHSKCATVTDRMFGSYTDLLIICGDGELDYYGRPDTVKDLQSKFQGWSGEGFWGSCEADPDEVLTYLKQVCKRTFRERLDWLLNG